MAILDLTNHCTGWILVVHRMQHLTGFLFYKKMEQCLPGLIAYTVLAFFFSGL
jgi:peptide deformylase